VDQSRSGAVGTTKRVVCQRFDSSKNSSDSSSSGGVAILMKLKPFWKTFGKTTSPVRVRL
jgi:hypothetical protein